MKDRVAPRLVAGCVRSESKLSSGQFVEGQQRKTCIHTDTWPTERPQFAPRTMFSGCGWKAEWQGLISFHYLLFSVSLKSFTDSIVTLSRIVAATSSHWLTDAGEFVSHWRRDSRDVVRPLQARLHFQLRILTSKVKKKKKKKDSAGKSFRRAAGGNVLFQLWRSVLKSFDSR